ncbi:MAG: TIM barrel protein [Puniceicoccales bacterium]|jgi:hypothetical protein|nr:TIM barrel protein [Puniceicoccales bacterium]
MRRLSVSSLAWPVSQDAAVRALLRKHGVSAVDFVPCKLFPDIAAATDAEVVEKRKLWEGEGCSFQGAQSLFFNANVPNLFDGADARARMLAHLRHVFRVSAGLGAKYLVFGSPNNRRRASIDLAAANAVATAFFSDVAVVARQFGVVLCLEPNPAQYSDCDFMRDSSETAQVVRGIGSPAVRMQLDTGALVLNKEDVLDVVQKHGDCIAYAHISEPCLRPVGMDADHGAGHQHVSQVLRDHCPDLPLCIEMSENRIGEAENLLSLERAIAFVKNIYP